MHSQAWNDRTVTAYMMSAAGDLALDNRGDLCWKYDYDEECAKLPAGQYRCGSKLATISREGWTLTRHGAEMILSTLWDYRMAREPKNRKTYSMLDAVRNTSDR